MIAAPPGIPLQARIAGLICLAMVAGMLGVGLAPFQAPRNGAHWLPRQNGIGFGPHATLLSRAPLPPPGGGGPEPECSIEMAIQAAFVDNGPTILAFSTPANPLQFSLRQYQSSLILDMTAAVGHPIERIGTPGVFMGNQPVFLTITSGRQGSATFVNGRLRATFPESHFAGACRGQFVIGTSPVAYNKWPGRIFRLVIFNRAISAPEAARNYRAWVENRPSEVQPEAGPVALYRFNERGGAVVHNAVPGGIDLYLPDRFVLLHQLRLEPFWNEYRPGWSHWKDILVNVVGFMPLGVFFYACAVTLWKLPKPALTTVALGFAVSLTIEVMQSYLPTRNSGTMDLITNTLGTFLGVRLFAMRGIWGLITRAL